MSHKAALRDPTVDLDISGKFLGDDDLKKISQELVKAINYRSPDRVLILEEVSLKGNNFGPKGVAAFASVIRAASSEIRSLDLSDNAIEIKNSQDAIAWETFLRSFGQCTALHRLDFSGNKLGQKGFELLLKVYAFEDGLIECGETSKAELGGLRSIPYICLSDTGLDDVCAMYLSYILEWHGFVEQLLPVLPQPKPGSQTHQLEAYDRIEGCNGIIWKPNLALHDLGTKVLEVAEALRKSRDNLEDEDSIDSQLSQSVGEAVLSNLQKSFPEARSRGDSLLSVDDSFHLGSSDVTCELMRARSRIILDALKIEGLYQNDLWMSAFKVLHYTRAILFGFSLGTVPPTKAGRRPTRNIENRERSRAFPPLPLKPTFLGAPKAKYRINETELPPRTVLSTGNPNNFNPSKIFLDRDGADDIVCKPFHVPYRPKTQRIRDMVQYLTPETMKQYSRQYRSDLPCGLSKETWVKIITYASGGEGILSDNQKATAIGWAACRESVVELRGVIGKHVSQQIYKALEGLDCLTYDI